MRIKNLFWLALSAGVAACHIGKNASEWDVAKSPAGAMTNVRTSDGSSRGELLEVSNDGIVLRRPDRSLVFAAFTSLFSLEIPGLGLDYAANAAGPMSEQRRMRLAKVSHFPQGMPAAARAQLLSAAGQKEVTVLH